MSVALKDLGAAAQKVQPLSITVDPKRDTPKVMADYLKAFDPRIVGLTGGQAQTDSVARAYHVYVARQKGNGDDYLVDHSAFFYVVDGQGRFVNVIPGDASGDEMAKRLRGMMSR